MTFVCALCGEAFEGDWTNEEAEAEMKSNFGAETNISDCDVVCNDCYKKIWPSAQEGGG